MFRWSRLLRSPEFLNALLLGVVLARLHIQVEIEAAVVTAAEMQPCIEASACKARLAFCFHVLSFL